MAIESPVIDSRTAAGIVRQILTLRNTYTRGEWTSQSPDDPGIVLAKLFGRLMEIVLTRLNGVPEKYFRSFLNLLGIDLLPGTPARTPLKFFLPAGNRSGGFVPAGTQVATSTMPSGNTHVFETESGIFVTPLPLSAAFLLSPGDDAYADVSPLIEATAGAGILLGTGSTPLQHSLYLAHDRLLSLAEAADLHIDLQVQTNPAFMPAPQDWRVVWERFVVDEKNNIKPEPIVPSTSSTVANLLGSGQIIFPNFPGTTRSTQNGIEANWIRARLDTPLKAATSDLPQIRSVQLSVVLGRTQLDLDAGFLDAIPLDLTKDFQPFGAQPVLANTFYMASRQAFSKPGANITLHVELSKGANVVPVQIELKWEYWNGTRWADLAVQDNSLNFSVGTGQGTAGQIRFTVPDIAETDVNGVVNFWIRTRIVNGNYGSPAHYIPIPPTSPVQFIFAADTFHPPSLSRLVLDYTFSPAAVAPQQLLTFNNFVFRDRLPLNGTGSFRPFAPAPPEDAGLYFGFDCRDAEDIRAQAFDGKPIAVFFGVANDETASTTSSESQTIWEYSKASNVWSRLQVTDGTEGLFTSGVVSFLGPADLSASENFQLTNCWFRGRFTTAPAGKLLTKISVNAVEATNAVATANEVLGSGNGKPNQPFAFSQRPVLPGEKVYVREQERPSDDVIADLEAVEAARIGSPLTNEERKELVVERTNADTGQDEVWVKWQQIDSFIGGGAQGRYYVLDRVSGVLTVGDGQNGFVPPIARDNVVAFSYRAGGGLAASKETKAGTIKDLRSSLPFVDSVTNIEDAEGGSDAENVAEALERGPQLIKNRDRAVTIEDYEWLAREASTLVHLVKCLPTTRPAGTSLVFEPGAVTLLLVPDTDEPKPRPSQELVRTVRDYILDRALPIIRPQIFIISPAYREIRISVRFVPVRVDEASVVESELLARLAAFLHPVKGSPSGNGWPFGRNVFISEIHQIIEDTPGVDVATSVVLNEDPALTEIEIGDNELPFSGAHKIVAEVSGA